MSIYRIHWIKGQTSLYLRFWIFWKYMYVNKFKYSYGEEGVYGFIYPLLLRGGGICFNIPPPLQGVYAFIYPLLSKIQK